MPMQSMAVSKHDLTAVDLYLQRVHSMLCRQTWCMNTSHQAGQSCSLHGEKQCLKRTFGASKFWSAKSKPVVRANISTVYQLFHCCESAQHVSAMRAEAARHACVPCLAS